MAGEKGLEEASPEADAEESIVAIGNSGVDAMEVISDIVLGREHCCVSTVGVGPVMLDEGEPTENGTRRGRWEEKSRRAAAPDDPEVTCTFSII